MSAHASRILIIDMLIFNRFQLQHHLQGPWPWLNLASSGHDPARPPHVEQQQQQRGAMLLKTCDAIECHYTIIHHNIQGTWPPGAHPKL